MTIEYIDFEEYLLVLLAGHLGYEIVYTPEGA